MQCKPDYEEALREKRRKTFTQVRKLVSPLPPHRGVGGVERERGQAVKHYSIYSMDLFRTTL